MTHQMFNVDGMTCESCVKKITENLRQDSRIENLHVTLDPPRIHFDSKVKYDAGTINQRLASLGKYSVSENGHTMQTKESTSAWVLKYMPLILLFGLCAGIPALNLALGRSDWDHWMYQFMGATLIALSYFKFLDPPKFAEAFATYDPIARKLYPYGYVYPFFELGAGIGLLLAVEVKALSILVVLFLLPTTIGVIQALRQKRKFQCACLGTAFNLPLTKVTIVENMLMMAMSVMIVL
ncbi:MAG: heavy-metal-associated domain-containing protein [Bacteriovoracia bacterium]